MGYDITSMKVSLDQLSMIAQVQAHEVRGPLASIMGLVEIMEREKNTGAQGEYLPLLLRACHKLDNVIHRIVDLTDDRGKVPD